MDDFYYPTQQMYKSKNRLFTEMTLVGFKMCTILNENKNEI